MIGGMRRLIAEAAGSGDMLWLVLGVAGLVTLVCVGLHYETIRLLISVLHRREVRRSRPALMAVVLVLFVAHLLEATVFALAYMVVESLPGDGAGRLVGPYDGSFVDSLYFSLACFTTVGFGDIVPQGPVRMLVGVEALAGLVLITWSASFTFLMMQRIFSKQFRLTQEPSAAPETKP